MTCRQRMIRQTAARPRARRWCAAAAAIAVVLAAGPVSAQLDPLLFLKRVPPTVILVMDTSMRMLEDGADKYYDVRTYSALQDPGVATAMGVNTMFSFNYRRVYHNLQYDNVQDSNNKFEATNITAVSDTDPGYQTFWAATRFEIAKAGIARAVGENAGGSYRWGLVRLRQSNPQWGGCDKPVRVTNNAGLLSVTDSNPCSAGGSGGRFVIHPGTVSGAAFNQTSAPAGTVVVAPTAAGTATTILDAVGRTIPQAIAAGDTRLVPASRGARTHEDRPLTHALADARAQAVAAMSADVNAARPCRNTVVVLIAGGKNEGDSAYMANNDVLSMASTFEAVSASGTTRRVPIVVIGVKPAAGDEAELQDIAARSGGRYFHVSDAAGVASAINYAVQSGFTQPEDFHTKGISGPVSEYQPVSPIVGTVNLKNAKDAGGAALPFTDIQTSPGGQDIPQRSNMLVTAGFSLPGFDGRIRAFRTFVPEQDATRPSGWKFVADGTPLWPDSDGRGLEGQARTPADPGLRNVFTFVPGATPGSGSVVAFTSANASTLRPALRMGTTAQAAALIDFVRQQPIGPVIGSTPALMDPPSLDPPPDEDYGRVDAAGTFAGDHKERRSIIFVGANNGMIHAIDARTGYEVWAFVPYNLLPRLRALQHGQPIDQFNYFVDSSPKIAEVKVNGVWRSLLIIGQGNGGTFYQTFDVTKAGMGGPAPDSDDHAAVLASFDSMAATNRGVRFMWAFPDYSSFEPAYDGYFCRSSLTTEAWAPCTASSDTSGGAVRFYGDLKPSATAAEKTVGFTWSDPAVGPLNDDRTVNALFVGSGYFPNVEALLPGRGSDVAAGRSFYVLKVEDGTLLGGVSACSTAASGTGCLTLPNANNGRKNALQADPSAAGEAGSGIVTKAYMGDVDGVYWRFNFTPAGGVARTTMVSTGQPIYASSALLFVGTTDQYVFFATGSDLLPPGTSGGTGQFKLFGVRDLGGSGSIRFTRNLTSVSVSSAGFTDGERPSTAPSVAGDIVFYTTTVEQASDPCADFRSNLYALTYIGGAAYDSDGDNKISSNESPIVRNVGGRATAPFIVDQHLYFGTFGKDGSNVEIFGDPEDFNNGVGQIGVRILSWREIR